ncbi:MAG: hypothetical protein H8E75_00070, partial [Puniceicoccaceae bacterium]|nr:hypothetical protein [Puniceicoccaceae bacterium]
MKQKSSKRTGGLLLLAIACCQFGCAPSDSSAPVYQFFGLEPQDATDGVITAEESPNLATIRQQGYLDGSP